MSDERHPETLPASYEDIEFDNNAQRLPLVLCLDTSSSMAGVPMEMLNKALQDWTRELHDDVSLSYSVEVAVVTFGGQGVTVWRGAQPLPPQASVSPFVPAYAFQAPVLTAAGVTLLTEALELALRIVAARKTELRTSGLQYYRPQICLVTDGLPTDGTGHLTNAWQRLVPVLTNDQAARRYRLYAIGVGNISDMGAQVLEALAPEFNARLHGFPFRELLQMMSNSINAERRGAGEEIQAKIFADFRTQRSAWDA